MLATNASPLRWGLITNPQHPLYGSTIQLGNVQALDRSNQRLAWLTTQLGKITIILSNEDFEDVTEVADAFELHVGDIVTHVKESAAIGQLVYLDLNLIVYGYDVTTCLVRWEDSNETQCAIAWTNKLISLS